MKNKCKYCSEEIDDGKIRCSRCNYIWSLGREDGKLSVKFKLRILFNDFKKLTGDF